jgi:hypothetical protein
VAEAARLCYRPRVTLRSGCVKTPSGEKSGDRRKYEPGARIVTELSPHEMNYLRSPSFAMIAR